MAINNIRKAEMQAHYTLKRQSAGSLNSMWHWTK